MESRQALSSAIGEYIAGVSKGVSVTDWLDQACEKADQLRAVTHPAKLTHSQIKSPGILAEISDGADDSTVGTHSLPNPDFDIEGNGALIAVANLLTIEASGISLLGCLRNGGAENVLAPLAGGSVEHAQAWCAQLSRVFDAEPLALSPHHKQVYWPVGAGYHLLVPLHSSSLTNAVWSRVTDSRFGKQARTAQECMSAGIGCASDVVNYPGIASTRHGGSKPHNISLLNSRRRGKALLLNAAPPPVDAYQWLPESGLDFWERWARAVANATRSLLTDERIRSANTPEVASNLRRKVAAVAIDELVFSVAALISIAKATGGIPVDMQYSDNLRSIAASDPAAIDLLVSRFAGRLYRQMSVRLDASEQPLSAVGDGEYSWVGDRNWAKSELSRQLHDLFDS